MICGAILAASLLLADLPDETLSGLNDVPPDTSAADLLERVRAVDGALRFDLTTVVVDTDRRWWASPSSGTPGAPLAEFRKWPGDTVLAVYAVPELPAPPVARAVWRPVPAPAGERRFEGTLDTDQGSQAAIWCERKVEGTATRLAALLAAGDTGLGAEGVAASRAALLDVWQRLAARPESWLAIGPLPDGRTVDLPVFGPEPREADERSDPWRSVAATGFTIGLPPGLRASRTDGDVVPLRGVEGGVLWLRGRFRDRKGASVTVGDAVRAGYVALVETADAGWLAGTLPPRGSPRATKVDGLPLDDIVLSDTASRAGRVERWTEAGWTGCWLVFRLAFETGRGLEIGLPIEGAWRSLALFWIPATIRPEGQPAAPPPIDAAERLGMRFERLRPAERARSPLTEGWLTAPGLRVELPRGWYPVVSIRAADGFPIMIHEASGELVGTIRRLRPADAATLTAAPADGWSLAPRPGIHGAAAVHTRPDGGRLFVSREGYGFLFGPALERGTVPAAWSQLTSSVALSRPKKP